MPSKYHFPLLLLVYATAYIVMYPAYQYVFDLDGVGYLSITKRLAAGDIANGLNGFWPPLHSWLAIPLHKAGLNEFAAFKLLNGLFGAGILVVVNRLLRKLSIEDNLRLIALIVCIPITLCYVFWEMAADILFCFLLLLYTDIITEKDLFTNPNKNIAAGFVGFLAYLTKTYALPFFFLHFAVVQCFQYNRSMLPHRKKLLTKNLLFGMGVFVVLATPWVVVLYDRYHFFTLGHVFIFGKSGQFNLSYYFHPNQSINYPLIVGPPSPLSSHWENPLYMLTQQPQYYGELFSLSMMAQQVRTILFNFIVLLKNLHSFSFMCNAIILALALFVWQKKTPILTLILSVIAILPAGYLLLHVEDRFLWPITFLSLLTGIVLSQLALRRLIVPKRIQIAYWCLFFGSFAIAPMDQLKDLRGSGKELFTLAEELKSKRVQGKYLSDNGADVQRLAYLTGSVYYQPTRPYQYDELLAACRQQNIQYYFFYYDTPQQLDAFKHTAFYTSALHEIPTKMPNLLLLKMN